MATAAAHWDAMDDGVDPLSLPPDRLMARVVRVVRARLSAGDFDRWWSRVNIPDPGTVPTSGPWSESEMTATFRQTQAKVGGA